MTPKQQALFEARAEIAKALAHPTRLFIVDMLSKGERCVCELREAVGADISTVSKHLSVLKKAGILEDDKRGLQVYYRLRCTCVLNFFSCIEGVLRENAKKQLALME
jgi:ArsR family transcriptional regulator